MSFPDDHDTARALLTVMHRSSCGLVGETRVQEAREMALSVRGAKVS